MDSALGWWLPLTLAALVLGYLLGSFPTGLVLTRLAGLGDIRRIGSGNIGATNVLRTGHKGLAAATLIGDLLKGTFAVLLATWWFGLYPAHVAAVGAFLGHLFPVWLNFRGGKGVATYIGVLAGLVWPAAVIFCLVWLAVGIITRYSSLSALTAAVLSPLAVLLVDRWRPLPDVMTTFLLAAALGLTLVYTHRANIQRLIAGTEPKIGEKSAHADAGKPPQP